MEAASSLGGGQSRPVLLQFGAVHSHIIVAPFCEELSWTLDVTPAGTRLDHLPNGNRRNIGYLEFHYLDTAQICYVNSVFKRYAILALDHVDCPDFASKVAELRASGMDSLQIAARLKIRLKGVLVE